MEIAIVLSFYPLNADKINGIEEKSGFGREDKWVEENHESIGSLKKQQ